MNLLKRLREERKTVAAYYSLVFPGEDEAGEDILASFNLVPSFVEYCDALRGCCDAIIEVKTKNEEAFFEKGGDLEKIAYWRRKLLHQVTDLKRFHMDLDDEKYRYTRICELLQEVKLYVDAEKAAGQDEGVDAE